MRSGHLGSRISDIPEMDSPIDSLSDSSNDLSLNSSMSDFDLPDVFIRNSSVLARKRQIRYVEELIALCESNRSDTAVLSAVPLLRSRCHVHVPKNELNILYRNIIDSGSIISTRIHPRMNSERIQMQPSPRFERLFLRNEIMPRFGHIVITIWMETAPPVQEASYRRAVDVKFDPIIQFDEYLKFHQGHSVISNKVEIVILEGPNASSSPIPYQFVRDIFYAANTGLHRVRSSRSFEEELQIVRSGKGQIQIVAVTWGESLPISPSRWQFHRDIGTTRIQLEIPRNRLDIYRSTLQRIKTEGWRVDGTIHLGIDIAAERTILFSTIEDPSMAIDQLKIYPDLQFIPEINTLMMEWKPKVPKWMRLNRLRIPGQVDLSAQLAARGISCQCLRCRELKNPGPRILQDISYQSSGCPEYLISYESPDGNFYDGFIRLRLELTYGIIRDCHIDQTLSNTHEITELLLDEAERLCRFHGKTQLRFPPNPQWTRSVPKTFQSHHGNITKSLRTNSHWKFPIILIIGLYVYCLLFLIWNSS